MMQGVSDTYSATEIISDARYPIHSTIIDKSSCPNAFEVLVPLVGANFIENKDIYTLQML
jgi:hypothetical protein